MNNPDLIERLIRPLYALSAIFAIVGALSVYINMNNEDLKEVRTAIVRTVVAVVLLVAAAVTLSHLRTPATPDSTQWHYAPIMEPTARISLR